MTQSLRLAPSSTRYDYVALAGGLDLLTPTLQLKSGYVRDALNWEVSISGGYARIVGYERFDGKPAPSAATYQTIDCVITGTVVAGNTIVGVTSGATGVVLSIDFGDVISFTKATGTFVAGESFRVGASIKGIITDLGGTGVAADYDARQFALAANVYRADILPVPGSGEIRGVAFLAGVTYAWRNNAGGTAMDVWRNSGGSWVNIPLGFEVRFTAGTLAYVIGSSINQGSASAIVRGLTLESGTWAAGTAAGRMIVANVSGGSFAAGPAVGGGAATLSGVQTAITLAPGGNVQTDIGNFGLGQKLYGVDGVNRAFEFDGTTLVPIATGNVPDTPGNVLVHKDHLWLSFGTNLQNSAITNPFNWTAVLGSASYRANDQITVLMRQPGDQSAGAMSVSTLTATYMLYGSSAANFQLIPFEESAGARKYSGSRLGGQSLVFSDLGVFSLSATQSFGNFTPASLTLKIRTFTQQRRNLCTASVVNREKSQYRVFFQDGYGLYITIVNGKLLGSMPVQFPNDVTCICQGDTPDGNETAFFGSSNGFVYRLDAGTSFDGQVIPAYWTLTFASQGNSRILKRYTGASFEMQGQGYCTFDFTYDLAYGSVERAQGTTPQTTALNLSPVFWDSFVWDTFTWDGRSLGPSQSEMRGTGENVAIRIDSSSDEFQSFTINSVILHYLTRKALKK